MTWFPLLIGLGIDMLVVLVVMCADRYLGSIGEME